MSLEKLQKTQIAVEQQYYKKSCLSEGVDQYWQTMEASLASDDRVRERVVGAEIPLSVAKIVWQHRPELCDWLNTGSFQRSVEIKVIDKSQQGRFVQLSLLPLDATFGSASELLYVVQVNVQKKGHVHLLGHFGEDVGVQSIACEEIDLSDMEMMAALLRKYIIDNDQNGLPNNFGRYHPSKLS